MYILTEPFVTWLLNYVLPKNKNYKIYNGQIKKNKTNYTEVLNITAHILHTSDTSVFTYYLAFIDTLRRYVL